MESRVISNIDDLDGYAASWEDLRISCRAPIFSSPDILKIWLTVFKEHIRPQIVVVEDDGEVVGLAPCSSVQHKAMGLTVTSLIMAGNGRKIPPGKRFLGFNLLGIMAKDDDGSVIAELARGIEKARWNVMQFQALEPTPTVLRLLELLGSEHKPQPLRVIHNMFYMFPEEGRVDGRFGRHNRKSLRQVRERLTAEGRLEFRVVEDAAEAKACMRTYVDQHIARWAEGGSIFQRKENARLLEDLAYHVVGKGKGLIYEAVIDGEVAGQALILFDGDMVRCYRIGMDDRFAEHSPGKLIMLLGMEDARRRGFKGWDLLGGTDEYKYHLTTNERDLASFMTQRGSLEFLSKVRNLPPVKGLDERMHIRERVLRRVYRY